MTPDLPSLTGPTGELPPVRNVSCHSSSSRHTRPFIWYRYGLPARSDQMDSVTSAPPPPDNRNQIYNRNRYSPAPYRYPAEPANQHPQRGFPVGRDNVNGRQYSTGGYSSRYPYDSSRTSATNVSSPTVVSSQLQYQPPQPISSTYHAGPSQVGPSQATRGSTAAYRPAYGSAQQPSANSQPRYNAPTLRPASQPRYSYYGDCRQPDGPERLQPVGHNNFDGVRPSQNTQQAIYGGRYNAPSPYKQLDYGPHGMVTDPQPPPQTNQYPRYSTTNGPARPPPNQPVGYRSQAVPSSQYTRQSAYQ